MTEPALGAGQNREYTSPQICRLTQHMINFCVRREKCRRGGMADAIDLGSITERCGGSSPLVGTSKRPGTGPWPSGKASPLQGEDRRFESDRVHSLQSAESCAGQAVVTGSQIYVSGRSSAVERLLAKEKVVSSNLIARSTGSAIVPTLLTAKWLNAEVAQSVEHSTENAGVPSSSLGLGTFPRWGIV